MTVVLMPVSGSKCTDWTAGSLVGFGLEATFALFGVAGFSALSTGADDFGRADTLCGFPGGSGSTRGT